MKNLLETTRLPQWRRPTCQKLISCVNITSAKLHHLQKNSLQPGRSYFDNCKPKGWLARLPEQMTRTCKDCMKSHGKNGCQDFLPATDQCIKHTQPTQYNDWWDKTGALPHLVSWAELVNGKDLSWVKSFTEYVYGSQLTAKHPVSVRCLWGTQETLIIALQNKREKHIKKKIYRHCIH